MRSKTNKIALYALLSSALFLAGLSYAAPSRLECLDMLGSSASKLDLDACVKGNPVQISKSSNSSGIETSEEEASCVEIGFKRKTPAFANCVLELMDRKAEKQEASQPSDPDDATCRKYGFKPKTTEYASCRLQIDQAKQAAASQNAQYQQQQKQYQEAERQRSIQANLALLQSGLNMMAGGGFGGGGGGSYGPAPIAPNPTQTYMLPGNKMLTCNTTGNITNCF
jgi:hypothetical protein